MFGVDKKCCIDGCDGDFVMTRKYDNKNYCRRHHEQMKKFGRIIDNDPTVYGVGINDLKDFNRNKNSTLYNELNARIYYLWKAMIKRCYYAKFHEEYPSYKDCEVCQRWHRLSNFVEDVCKIEGYELWVNNRCYCLDKDIKGNGKLYSLDTCCFISKSDNSRESVERNQNANKRIKVKAIKLDGSEEIIFDSLKDAKNNGFVPTTMKKNIKGLTKHYKGYKWSYVNKK